MTKDKEKKLGKERQLLEAARLGQLKQLESILNQFQQNNSKRRTNPLASLRKCSTEPGSVRDPVTGFTCLHHAALNGHVECVALILDRDACKLNAVDYKGSSALHLAAWAGNLQVVRLLLNSRRRVAPGGGGGGGGADGCAENQAATLATKDECAHSCSKWPMHGELNIDLLNNDKQTALSLAAQFGHNEVVAQLLACGADVHARNTQLESALDLACSNGRLETARLLLDSSAELRTMLSWPRAVISAHSAPAADHGPEARPNSTLVSSQQQQRRSQWSNLLSRGSSSSSSSSGSAAKSTCSPQLSPSQAAANHHSASLDQAHEHAGEQLARRASLAAPRTSAEQQTHLLLDHSPLHLAVRRNHFHLVSMLLARYQANMMQLTSLGSVLHELAMSASRMSSGSSSALALANSAASANGSSSAANGKLQSNCIDMIRLLWNHCLEQLSSNSLEQAQLKWRDFLRLKNARNMGVFALLSELNTRHAHQVKQLIYEFSEFHLLKQQSQNAPELRAGIQAERDVVFSNSQQINSFVTMKRVPKNQQLKENMAPGSHQWAHQQQAGPRLMMQPHALVATNTGADFPSSQTQTIDRRTLAAERRAAQPVWPFEAAQQQPQQPMLSSQREGEDYEQQLQMRKLLSHFQWQSLDVQAQQSRQQQQLQMQLDDTQAATRRQRSRSRDFGSMFTQAQQQQQQLSAAQEKYGALERSQIVRSQTDCSHLMGRFCDNDAPHRIGGPDSQQLDSQLAANSTASNQIHAQHHHHHHPQQQQQEQLCNNNETREPRANLANYPTEPAGKQQASATLDRCAINRMYHVYEHEFYPPRLLNQHQLLGQNNGSAASEIGGSSARATDCAQVGKNRHMASASTAVKPASPLRAALKSPLQLRHDSRLSLNIEPTSSQSCDAFLAAGSSSQLNHNHQQHYQQHFLTRQSSARHSMQAYHLTPCDTAGELALSNQQQQQQPVQALHPSQSLESRLSERAMSSNRPSSECAFEHTRQALMHDIDQLIGRELLSRAPDMQSRNRTTANSSSSQSSIMTGISLDMDTLGENIIVSGTRITLPTPLQTPVAQQRLSGQQMQLIPPEKPPRPSIRSQQIYKSQQALQHRPQSRNYAAPEMMNQQQSNDSRVCHPSEPAAPTRPPIAHKRLASALSEPPSERPPPPPLSAPLNLAATTERFTTISSCSSSTSSTSSSSNANELRAVVAARTTLPPTGASVNLRSKLELIDSGVCTSNSPASLSHDSEGPVSYPSNSFQDGQSTLAGNRNLDEPMDQQLAGEQQFDERPPLEHEERALISARQRSFAANSLIAPPSPNTAQMCIEDLLLPLENSPTKSSIFAKTSDQMTMTSSCDQLCDDRPLLGSFITDWIRRTSSGSRLATQNSEPDYENCIKLQQHLSNQPTQFDCQLDGQACRVSTNEASISDDGDYAATSDCEPEQEACAVELASLESLSSSHELCELAESAEEQTQSSTKSERKEILVKIVIDASEQSADGNQVYYLNPTELKKMSSNDCGEPTRDAETLTDEELCASLEKHSGLIKFTLRKRIGVGAAVKQVAAVGGNLRVESQKDEASVSASLKEDDQLRQQAPKRSEAPLDNDPRASHCNKLLKAHTSESSESNESALLDQSHSSSSGSSSSAMSIKSIVSIKTPALKNQEACNDGASESDLAPKLSSRATESGQARNVVAQQELGSDERLQLGGTTGERQIKSPLVRQHSKQAAGSTVTETARRLEQASVDKISVHHQNRSAIKTAAADSPVKGPSAAARSNLVYPKKSATIRENNMNNKDILNKIAPEPRPSIMEELHKSRSPVVELAKSICDPVNDEAEEKIAPLSKSTPSAKRPVWPPRTQETTVEASNRSLASKLARSKHPNIEPEAKIDNAPESQVMQPTTDERSNKLSGLNNFATLRSSFEAKLRQQQQQQQQQQLASKSSKPNLPPFKPQPPMKPKNLVATTVSKFNNQ